MYHAIYWKNEELISVVRSKCMDPPNAKPYTDCTVKDGKKSYKGLAVGYGKIYIQYTLTLIHQFF